MRKMLWTLIPVLLVVAVIVGGVCGYKPFVYSQANRLLNQQRYEEAIWKYNKLSGYKDTERMKEKCYYLWAKEYYNSQKYQMARIYLMKSGNYSNNIDDEIVECYVAEIEYYISMSKYEDATTILKQAKNIIDSAVLEEYIDQLFDEWYQYQSSGVADSLFEVLPSNDSYKVNLVNYYNACNLESTNSEEALRVFSSIQLDFKDVLERINSLSEPLFIEAQELENSSYMEALKIYRKIPSFYKTTSKKIEEISKYEDIIGNYELVSRIVDDREKTISKSVFAVDCYKDSDKVMVVIPSTNYEKKHEIWKCPIKCVKGQYQINMSQYNNDKVNNYSAKWSDNTLYLTYEYVYENLMSEKEGFWTELNNLVIDGWSTWLDTTTVDTWEKTKE